MNKQTIMKVLLPVAAVAASVGIGFAGISSAQVASTSVGTSAIATTATTDTNDAQGARPQGHMPLGQDGNVTAISGTTITMQEEADEGGATYTVDASKATVDANGATGSLSQITVGEKIFVQGTVSGTSVSATSVSTGHPGGHGRPDGQ